MRTIPLKSVTGFANWTQCDIEGAIGANASTLALAVVEGSPAGMRRNPLCAR
jgi:hypothetical protein